MVKKAQTTIGQVLIGFFLFTLLLMGSFTFFAGHLNANDVDLSNGVSEDNFTAQFARFNSEFENTSSLINSNRSQTPNILGVDFLATGIDSIKASWATVDFARDYITFAQTNSPLGNILPDTFWGLLIAISTIILVLVVLGALWRYPLTK